MVLKSIFFVSFSPQPHCVFELVSFLFEQIETQQKLFLKYRKLERDIKHLVVHCGSIYSVSDVELVSGEF